MLEKRRSTIINASRVLREIWTSGTISRVELAQVLGLNKSTITAIIDRLIEREIVIEGEENEAGPRGGRKPIKLSLNLNYGYVIGLEVQSQTTNVVALDLEGTILYSRSHLERGLASPGFKDDFICLYKEILGETSHISKPLLGVGVGLPGVINLNDCIIMESGPLGFKNSYNFFSEIGQGFDVPVYIENDANCCAWSELVFHRSTNLQNFLFVFIVNLKGDAQGNLPKTWVPALGFGLGINGRVYRGQSHSAGEFRGVRFSHNENPYQLVTLEAHKDQDYFHYSDEFMISYLNELAENLAMLVNTMSLDTVFFGGDVDVYGEKFKPILAEAIERNWMYNYRNTVDIRFSSLGDLAAAFGAAGLVIDRLFMDLEKTENWNNGRQDSLLLQPNLQDALLAKQDLIDSNF